MKRLGPLLLALASCGDSDPCDGVSGRCLALHVESASVERIDQLELDVLYGTLHDTVTTSDGVVDLPVVTAVKLPGSGTIDVGVVAAGKLSGMVLGTGAAQATLAAGAHAEMLIELAPVVMCVADSFYCGGDKIAGDPDVLYLCNGGGVPLARGTCINGCVQRQLDDDLCAAGPTRCTDGGFYCGGDQLGGDPQSLYRCSAGAGIDRMVCPDGCVIEQSPYKDHCR